VFKTGNAPFCPKGKRQKVMHRTEILRWIKTNGPKGSSIYAMARKSDGGLGLSSETLTKAVKLFEEVGLITLQVGRHERFECTITELGEEVLKLGERLGDDDNERDILHDVSSTVIDAAKKAGIIEFHKRQMDVVRRGLYTGSSSRPEYYVASDVRRHPSCTNVDLE
jgi:DNA-binding HxlR family transcriptional regulator